MLRQEVIDEYRRQRETLFIGGRIFQRSANVALYNAKAIVEFTAMRDEGKVRITMAYEKENYFDVFGQPEGYEGQHGWVTPEEERVEIEDMIQSMGCYVVMAETWNGCQECGRGEWEMVDSVGMCIYSDPTDPYENEYVPGMMKAAIEAVSV